MPLTAPSDPFARSASLADRLAEQLRIEIVRGKLLPGAQLPTEAQVAQQYSVSRATVREAIGRLRHDGLVVARQGAGVFVADAGNASAFRIETPDLADRTELRAVIEFLSGVESTATALAAERRSEADLAALREALDGMKRAVAEKRPGVEADIAFHRAIVAASGNALIRDFSHFLEARVRQFIRAARANTARLAPETAQAVQTEHERIYEAIARRDPAAAKAAAEAHLLGAAERLSIYLA
jgi:GntR family transcriptional regulator, transcriptional repressor for pyruvate dehydrogenase complex